MYVASNKCKTESMFSIKYAFKLIYIKFCVSLYFDFFSLSISPIL